jgi:hypothetical protein
MKRCLDEGLLQAYLDGELSQELTREAAAHVAACAACADALAEAESEAAFFATAFAPDDSISVPTEALRSRIGAAVARLESGAEAKHARPRGWSFGGFLASLSGLLTFTPQSAAAFASLLAVVALAIVFFAIHKSPNAPGKNQNDRQIAGIDRNPEIKPGGNVTTNNNKSEPGATPEETNPKKVFRNAGYRRSQKNRTNTGGGTVAPAPLNEKLLPGEKEYQTAIASLEKTIRFGGDATLRPDVRVKYERDIAILDSAIKETRRVAAENPKDRDAAGFLMSVYQSKVELLTKVADQAQVAALGH